MNKYKLIGLALALVMLIAAIAARMIGGATLVTVMLPILTVGLWALTAIDILSYRKYGSESKVIRSAELARVVSLGVISALLTVAVILSLIF